MSVGSITNNAMEFEQQKLQCHQQLKAPWQSIHPSTVNGNDTHININPIHPSPSCSQITFSFPRHSTVPHDRNVSALIARHIQHPLFPLSLSLPAWHNGCEWGYWGNVRPGIGFRLVGKCIRYLIDDIVYDRPIRWMRLNSRSQVDINGWWGNETTKILWPKEWCALWLRQFAVIICLGRFFSPSAYFCKDLTAVPG